MSPERAIGWAWAVWVLSWFAAAVWARRTEKSAGLGAEALHLAVTCLGLFLVFARFGNFDGVPHRGPWAFEVPSALTWPVPPALGWALFAVAVAGFAFCWWARLHLGQLWSGSVTRKPGHRVVDTGPYALVRHPIYTGLILAAAATALDRGSAFNVAGAVLVIVGFWIKARLEERFLRAELGAQAYDDYARRVPMLVPQPFPPPGGRGRGGGGAASG